MKTKFNLLRRNGVFYTEDTTTGKQTSLRTKDETEAKSLLNAKNEAQRQPNLNLHLARAYLTASDPAFVERTWQTVMEQLQSRGKDSSRERYATVFKSASYDALRQKKLLETTADDFFAVFKDGKVSIVYFLKRLHNFALSLGWIAIPIRPRGSEAINSRASCESFRFSTTSTVFQSCSRTSRCFRVPA